MNRTKGGWVVEAAALVLFFVAVAIFWPPIAASLRESCGPHASTGR